MVEKLLAAMAAGAVWPSLASALDWKPVFLNPQQNETLLALSESIVPGSAKVQVNRFVDLLLSFQANIDLAFAHLASVGKLQRQMLKVEGSEFVFEAALQGSR